MLVTFKTKAHADITMFGDDALALLQMMGHGATVPGAVLAADVSVALSQLTAAIEAEKTSAPPESKNDDKDDDKDDDAPHVSMAHRAMPLLELLAAAAKENVNVMWK